MDYRVWSPQTAQSLRQTQRDTTDYTNRKVPQIWGAMIYYSQYLVCATIFCNFPVIRYYIVYVNHPEDARDFAPGGRKTVLCKGKTPPGFGRVRPVKPFQ